MTTNFKFVSCAVLALGFAAPAFAQETTNVPQPITQTTTHVVKGQLLNLDAQSAWAGRAVRVRSFESPTVVAATLSDRNGAFELKLAPGKYYAVAGALVAPFEVKSIGKQRKIVMLGGRDAVDAKQSPIEIADTAGAGGGSGNTPIFLGVGGLVITGLAITAGALIYSNNRSSDNEDKRIIDQHTAQNITEASEEAARNAQQQAKDLLQDQTQEAANEAIEALNNLTTQLRTDLQNLTGNVNTLTQNQQNLTNLINAINADIARIKAAFSPPLM